MLDHIATRSAMLAFLRMVIRSRVKPKRVEGLRRPLYVGWTRIGTPAPFVRPAYRRRLGLPFTEWLMGWPTGLSGFERAATELSRWLLQSRGCLSEICLVRTAPPEAPRLL